MAEVTGKKLAANRAKLKRLIGKRVKIKWADYGDWPYFTVTDVGEKYVILRGEDNGMVKHRGDTFWTRIALVGKVEAA